MPFFRVYKEHPEAKMPSVAYNGTSGAFDIFATEDITIWPGQAEMIPVGIRIIIPDGYYIEFHTRSGHGISKQLRVHPGIIDSSYTGTLAVCMRNFGSQPQTIKKDSAVTQCTIHKIPEFKFIEINEQEFNDINSTSIRGNKGFGSTDKI